MQAGINVGKVSTIVIPSIVAVVTTAGVSLQKLKVQDEEKDEVLKDLDNEEKTRYQQEEICWEKY